METTINKKENSLSSRSAELQYLFAFICFCTSENVCDSNLKYVNHSPNQNHSALSVQQQCDVQ